MPLACSAWTAGAIAPLPALERSARRVGACGARALERAEAGERLAGARRGVGVGQLDVQRRLAHVRLEVLRRALGDEPPARDDPDPVSELLGLLEVLGGQEDGGALVVEAAQLAPQRRSAGGVEARGGLVEEEHGRTVHERQREVEAPAHAARVARRSPASVSPSRSSSDTARSRGPAPRSPCSASCMRAALGRP